MKTTTVPAQITTVEDKIAGNLSLSQLLLLAAPAFIGTAIYIILPPTLNISPYKIVCMLVLVAIFGSLAIRVKGKILLLWGIIIVRYNLRPRYYVFNKNDMHLRDAASMKIDEIDDEPVVAKQAKHIQLPQLSTADTVMLEGIIADPKANLRFMTDKKGALNVRFNEVK
ncbi:MAG TPA: PrgI family protein [Patescibacteria group bacterium]|nr:PrgI family protein [Patescibacteria group bacterium]